MTDPVADLLTRLRNSAKAGQAECVIPHSKLKENISKILSSEGFVGEISTGTDEAGHKTLVVKLKYLGTTPAFNHLTRVSTPGRRLYYSYTEIPRVLNGLGIAILSTSKGVLNDRECRRQKVGGELICNVW